MKWIEREWTARGLSLEPSAAEPGAAELEALVGGALLVPLLDAGSLRIRGADRVDFLHGQLSNDVRGLKRGETNRSLLLNHRGHGLADMRVFKGNDELMVLVDGAALDLVEESLRRHIIFDQVELERRPDKVALSLQGPASAQILREVLGAEPPAGGEYCEGEFQGGPVMVAAAARSAAGGFDLIANEGAADHAAGADGANPHGLQLLVEAFLAAGAVPGSRPALELARVRAAIASAAGEAGDGVLPQEAGLEPLVSYRKGCYLGQEIMARIEARGKLRRELAGLHLDGLPARGERDITAGGKVVGRLGRVVRDPDIGLLALAVLRNDLDAGAVLMVGGVTCRPAPLPIEGTPVAG